MSEPIPSYGTTNIGYRTVLFLLLAVDKRVTKDDIWHRLIAADADQKLFELSSVSNIYITAAGSVRAWDQLYDFLKKAVCEEEVKTRRPTTVDFVKKMVEKHVETGAASWKDDVYCGIMAGWPMGGVGEMHKFHIEKNRADIMEIPLSKFSTIGSGGIPAGRHLLNYVQPYADRAVAGQLCLEGIVKASQADPNTGGGGVVGCLEEGKFTLIYDYNALQAYSSTFDMNSKSRVLFLFIPSDSRANEITVREIRRDWGLIKVSSASIVAVLESLTFYQIVLMTEKDVENAIFEFSLPKDEPDLQQVTSASDLFSTLPTTVIRGIRCGVSKASRSLIDLVERLQEEEDTAQV